MLATIQSSVPNIESKIENTLENVLRLHRQTQIYQAQMNKMIQDLGFPGGLEDRLKIDDGLGEPYFVPLEYCDTPKVGVFPSTSLQCFHRSEEVGRRFWMLTNTIISVE